MRRLLNWLRSFMRPSGTYSPKERLLFSFFDGNHTVKADPHVLYRAIMQEWPSLKADLSAASLSIPNSFTAKSQKASAAKLREIFCIPPLRKEMFVDLPDGTETLSDIEIVDLFNEFMLWCERLKKNMSQTPISVTETLEPSASFLAVSPPIPSTLGSGLTETAKETDVSTSSTPEQVSPSDSSIPDTAFMKT